MLKVQKDYEELLRLFNKHKVRYCIVGAYALGFYVLPRYTKDMDLLVEPSVENAKRIVTALHAFGFGSLNITPKDFSSAGKIVQLGYEPIRIDIITSIDGCAFKQVWQNRKKGFYGKTGVYFIGINELIKNKNASARKQDLADLDVLKSLKKGVKS